MKRIENYKYYYKQATKPVALIALIIGFLGVLIGAAGLFLAVHYSQLNKDLIDQQQAVQPVQLVAEGDVTSLLAEDSIYPLTYQVKAGDSLWKISEQFYGHGCYYNQIVVENNLQNPNHLTIGMELEIPQPPREKEVIGLNEDNQRYSANNSTKLSDNFVKNTNQSKLASEDSRENSEHFTYQVEKGDSLWFIALKYYDDGSRWTEIYQANKVVIGNNPDLIFPDAKLHL